MHSDDRHSTSVRGASDSAEPPWDLIAERIDALAAAWDRSLTEHGPPPSLGDFVAGLAPVDARAVLGELIKLDVERRWQHQLQPKAIERYVEELPVLGPLTGLPVDVVYEELQARMMAGRPIYEAEILQRFPAQAESLIRLMGGMALSGSPTATYFGDTVVDANKPPKPKPAPTQNRVAAFAHLKPGDQLDDFQLLTPLGSGAFARVFLARQTSMERLVALKISQQVGSEPQTLAQLDHPHIVRVYDQRQTTDPPARLLYMEVVSGGTLQDAIARVRHAYDGKPSGELLLDAIDERLNAVGTPIPESSSARDWIADASWPEVVCRLGAEMAEGLAYAHSRGVMHRDIKPANVLLSAEGRPKLADFNVSYNGGRSDENPEDTFGGSLAYMSPEQLEACHPLLGGSPRMVREPSDLYALGVLLWELLTGRRPFRDEAVPRDGGSLVRLQRMIETRRQTDFAEVARHLPPDCPASLREVLAKALQPDKDNRYQTADEFSRALRLCLNRRCWNLLQPPKSTFGRWVLRHPLLAGIICGLVPNLLTARLNYSYNLGRITDMAREPHWKPLLEQFNAAQWWINAVAFGLGIGLGAWITLRAVRLMKGDPKRMGPNASGQILLFGQFVSLLIIALWTASGLIFPIAVAWGPSSDVGVGFYIHFFLSLALCGCAATAYPYFLVTAASLHFFVPAMVRNGSIAGPRRRDLDKLPWLNAVHLVMAALVPMLGVLLMVQFGDGSQDWALMAASGGGMVGLAAVLLLKRQIDLDAEALTHIAIDERRGAGGSRTSRRTRGTR